MQEAALMQISGLRETKSAKGLIISATGTVNTYLAAMNVRVSQPKGMLFIVHREPILISDLGDFIRILCGRSEYVGILSDTRIHYNAKYLFSTIQTISRTDYLSQFKKDESDYILIDEVHRAGASSYERVLDYFKPEFLLGMTATPERTDDYNI